MKKFASFLICFFVLFSSISCKKDAKSGKKDKDPVESDFTVMSNSADPMIATCTTKTGEKVEFYGTRDNNGVPVSVDHIQVNKANDTTIYTLDAEGRPIKIVTQNGNQLEFDWVSNQKAVVTVLTKDGETQLNTDIDFTGSEGIRRGKTNVQNIRADKSLKLIFHPFDASTSLNAKVESSDAKCVVNVFSCGTPADAEVRVIVKDKSGNHLGTFPTQRTSKGVYSSSIPSSITPTINPSQICNSIATTLNKACVLTIVPGLTESLCVGLASAIGASGVAAPVAAAIFASCESVAIGVDVYCGTLGYDGDGPSLAEQICNAEILNRTFSEDIVIYAMANSIPLNSYSPPFTVPGKGPFPPLNIDLTSETAVKKLSLIPSSPAASQDYTASCGVFCLKAGTKVKLSIVGSDGYMNSESTDITSNQAEGVFDLIVPGADTGVEDEVTLEITLPNGSVIKRVASLIFGT